MSVIERHDMKIDAEDDVILVRRKVRELALACRFDAFSASAITTAASELARNVWSHAGKGRATVERIDDETRQGVRAVFEDDGPGIEDMDRVLKGGHSTANTMGLGLSGSKRLVDEFEIASERGRGTKVTVVKWTRY